MASLRTVRRGWPRWEWAWRPCGALSSTWTHRRSRRPGPRRGGYAALALSIGNLFCMVLLYGRAGRLTAQNGGFWPGQVFLLELPPHEGTAKQLEATFKKSVAWLKALPPPRALPPRSLILSSSVQHAATSAAIEHSSSRIPPAPGPRPLTKAGGGGGRRQGLFDPRRNLDAVERTVAGKSLRLRLICQYSGDAVGRGVRSRRRFGPGT
jgi:hypothetical protein